MEPRRGSSSASSSGRSGERRVGAHAAGVRARRRRRASRLWSRADRQGDRVAAVADRDDARLAVRRAAPRRRTRPAGAEIAAAASSSGVADGHALAGREPVGLDDDPRRRARAPSRRRAPRTDPSRANDPAAGHRDAGRLGDLAAERLRALDPGRGRRRPEHRDAGLDQGIRDAGREGRLRPDRRRARRRSRRASATTTRRARRADRPRSTPDPRLRGRSRRIPGATRTSFTPGSAASFQASACSRPPPPTIRIRVGWTSRAHRRPRGRPRIGPRRRWRIGRHARSIVWVRSGPTDTSTIGAPACSSSAVT